jgi:hypothetical protein
MLFESMPHFADFTKQQRAEVAGFNFSRRKEIDWGIFGSMKGAGYFKKLINDNSPIISNALDQIPTNGPVSRDDWQNYVEVLHKGNAQGMQIGTATRLVAMKRPDYFVSVNSAARKNLSKGLQIAANSFSLENYWDYVIEPVMDTPWWSSKKPKDPLESRIWHARAAMLDMILYDPKKVGD